jgi:uncharacterized protein
MKTHLIRLASILLVALLGTACVAEVDTLDSSDSELGGHPHFDLFKGADGQFYFNLVASNYEVILSSEGYTRRTGAINGVLSVLDNAGFRGNFEVNQASNGQYYFNLKAGNGQIIGTSELYVTRAGADNGIASTTRSVADYFEYWHQHTGARCEVFQGASGTWRFNVHAKNGAVVLSSQAYKSGEASAINGCFSVKDNGVDPARYDLREAKSGGWYFNLKASNGQVIGTSEVYANKSNAQRAINAIVALLPDVDLL